VEDPQRPANEFIYSTVRFLTVLGTLAILVCLALYLLWHAFSVGVPDGIRSLSAVVLPILAGSFLSVVHRPALRAFGSLPTGVAFSVSLLAGALVMVALRFLSSFSPIPIAELLIASCISVLVFASESLPRLALDIPDATEDRSLALFYGVATGMLLYIVLLGFPRLDA